MQKALTLGTIISALVLSMTNPAQAEFVKLEDKQELRKQENERLQQQADDIAALRDAQQQLNILMKGLLVEVRKQTVLLDSQTTEQQNVSAEIQKQTTLLEHILEEMEESNKKKKKKSSKE